MKVLITGAGGFVCSHLAKGLQEQGYAVFALDRHYDEDTRARLKKCELLTQDARAPLDIGPLDAIVHGAAITAAPETCGKNLCAYLHEGIESTLSLLEQAAYHTATRFIFLSSAAVFTSEQPSPLTEFSAPDATSPYAVAKRFGELIVQSLRSHTDFDAISLRLGNLYGPYEVPRTTRPRTSLVQRMLDEALNHNRITVRQPDQVREWTYIQDLAPALHHLLTSECLPYPVLHLCAPEAITELNLAESIAARLPNTQFHLCKETPQTIRPPLASALADSIGLPDWTPLERGFGLLARSVERIGT